MDLIADGLLIATALAASIYCAVLGRRLRRLASTEDGIGGQIAALNGAVEETRSALETVQERIEALRTQSGSASDRVRREINEAERLSGSLETASAEARRFLDQLYSVLDTPAGAGAGASSGAAGTGAQQIEADDGDEDFQIVGGQVATAGAATEGAGEPAAEQKLANGAGVDPEAEVALDAGQAGAPEGAMGAALSEPSGDDEAWASPAADAGDGAAGAPAAKGLLKIRRMGF
ncbi:MAG: hypothetical protein AAGG47_01205 [Pseudomonadota bacterium]